MFLWHCLVMSYPTRLP